MNGQVVVVLVLLLHYRCLVHKLVSELDLAFVVSFNAALVEEFKGVFRVSLSQETLGVDNAQIVVSLTEAFLLRLCQKAYDGLVELVVPIRTPRIRSLLLGQLAVQEQDGQVVARTRERCRFSLGVIILSPLLIPPDREQLLGVRLEIPKLVYFSQFSHSLGTIIGNLVQNLIPLLNIAPILSLTGTLAIDQAQTIPIAGIGLLSGHAFLVVCHSLLQIHRDQCPLLIDLPQKGTGLRVSPIGLLVVYVETLHDIFLPIYTEEELIGIVQTIGFSACISDHFLNDLHLLNHRLLHLYHLALGPLLLQQFRDELIVSLGKFRTDKGLDPIFRLEESQHLPLTRDDLEIIHGRLEPFCTISPAAQKLCIFYPYQILPYRLQGGLSIVDQLSHLRVDLKIQRFFLEYGPDILETIINGIHMLPILPRGALLILLHLAQQSTDILIQLSQTPQEILLWLVDLGTSFGPLVLGQLVGTLLLDFVDAPNSGDYLVVD